MNKQVGTVSKCYLDTIATSICGTIQYTSSLIKNFTRFLVMLSKLKKEV